MGVNTKFTMTLSLDSIDNFEEMLLKKKKELPQISERIVKKVSEIGLKENYQSTELLPIENTGGVISGGIRTTDEKDTYREFGTGMVGSSSPHIPEMLSLANWKYYLPSEFKATVNGVEGWYTNKDEFGEGVGFVIGIPAEKKFYEAMRRMESSFSEIAKSEFNK